MEEVELKSKPLGGSMLDDGQFNYEPSDEDVSSVSQSEPETTSSIVKISDQIMPENDMINRDQLVPKSSDDSITNNSHLLSEFSNRDQMSDSSDNDMEDVDQLMLESSSNDMLDVGQLVPNSSNNYMKDADQFVPESSDNYLKDIDQLTVKTLSNSGENNGQFVPDISDDGMENNGQTVPETSRYGVKSKSNGKIVPRTAHGDVENKSKTVPEALYGDVENIDQLVPETSFQNIQSEGDNFSDFSSHSFQLGSDSCASSAVSHASRFTQQLYPELDSLQGEPQKIYHEQDSMQSEPMKMYLKQGSMPPKQDDYDMNNSAIRKRAHKSQAVKKTYSSKSLSSSEIQQPHFWKSKLFFIVFLALAATAAWFYLSPRSPNGNDQSPFSKFVSQVSYMEQKFPNQSERFWRTVKASTSSIFRNDDSKRPAVILMASSTLHASEALCIAKHISAGFEWAWGSSANASLVDINHLKHLDAAEQKMRLDNNLNTAFSVHKRKSFIIESLQFLNPAAALIFYNYCDSDTAPFNDVMILLTLYFDEKEDGMENPATVENYLEKIWINGLDMDKINPLMSRVANHIVIVRAENSLTLSKICSI